MRGSVRIQAEILAKLADHARLDPRQECCGLLAGHGGIVTASFAARNAVAHTATRYEIAPEELFPLMRAIRAAGLDLMGIYHSHPSGPNEPSPRDIECAYYPEGAYFIVSPQPDALRPVRAYSIRDGRVAEIEIQVL